LNEKLEQAKKEGRLLVFTITSDRSYPMLLAFGGGAVSLVHAPNSIPRYQVHMLTRRTHLNPGESAKIALMFEGKIPEMPQAAYLELVLALSYYTQRFSLREDERSMTYDEITARSEAYEAQLEADRKAERKRRRRTIARV